MSIKQEISADHEMSQPESAHFPPDLLKLFFDKLRLSVQTGALNRACLQSQPEGKNLPPMQRITAILRLLKLRGVQDGLMKHA